MKCRARARSMAALDARPVATSSESGLEGLFLAKFDDKVGRRLVYEEPKALLSSSALNFDAISEFLIPKPQVRNRAQRSHRAHPA